MARPPQTPIRMRITVQGPVPGVFHSLQDKRSAPVDTKQSKDGTPLTFDFAIRMADGPRFFGEQVRNEGPTRQFVYIAIGAQAGQHVSEWSRRMKIDIHDAPADLLAAARGGATLHIAVPGKGPDGTPACATIHDRRWGVAG